MEIKSPLPQQPYTTSIDFDQNQAHCFRAIPRISRDTPIPCSVAQQQLWRLDQQETDNRTYTIPLFCRALGALNIAVLQAAVHEIIHRHESLRTIFCAADEADRVPRQRILPSLSFDAAVTDLSNLDTSAADSNIRTLASHALNTPFDLSQGPLLRLHILKIARQHHVLLFTAHHMVFDRLSLDVFRRELSALYSAFAQGKASPLPKPRIQYADYSVWQRRILSGRTWAEQLGFWRKTLDGASVAPGLPTDRPRPVLNRYTEARQHFEVDSCTTHKFRRLSQQNRATPFMAFQTVLAILLARYSGENDIIIGTPVANRRHRQLEPLIGCFANTLALRSKVEPDNSFNALLVDTKNQTEQAFKHQDIPFDTLIDELNIERSCSYNPLFQVVFSFQNTHTDGCSLPGLDLTPLAINYTVSRFDLSFILREHTDTFTVSVDYSTALFKTFTIQCLLSYFQTLIDVIVAQPERPIGQLPVWAAQTVFQPRQTQPGFA